MPLGTQTFTLTVNDGKGGANSASVAITVRDTTPPQVTASMSTITLWPPNHNLVIVGLSFSGSDTCDAQPVVTISVTADEPAAADGDDGVFSPDARYIRDAPGNIVGLRLRAERKEDGNGRVYLVKLTAADKAGNSASKCLAVTVPHDQNPAAMGTVAAEAAAAAAACAPLANNVLGPPPDGPAPVIGPKQ
jgi:hypothetical protein